MHHDWLVQNADWLYSMIVSLFMSKDMSEWDVVLDAPDIWLT